MADRLKFVRVGMKNHGTSVKLKLRWDMSPKTCEIICKALPFGGSMWHAKYANHEIYTLLPVEEIFGADPPGEWQTMYPGPGDLIYIFHPPGLLPRDVYDPDHPRRIVDIALFYDRGNSLYGPTGPNEGNIFATVSDVEELEKFAESILHVWKHGFINEHLYVEVAD